MKTMHFFHSYLHPTEQWAYNLLRNLPRAEVHVAARYYLKYNFYDRGFHYCPSIYGDLIARDFSLPWNKLQNWLPKLFAKSIYRIWDKESAFFAEYARDKGIDLLHAHFGPTAWLFREVVTITKLPLVISFYGYDYHFKIKREPVFEKRYRQLFDLATLVTAEGPHGASQLEKLGCPANKIKVLPLGIKLKASLPERRRHFTGKNFRLLQIASFAKKKGQIHTIQAFKHALLTYPDLELTLVGNEREEGLRAEVEQYIQNHSLADKVQILDWIDYQQLHPFMSEYDAFIHPSLHTPDGDCEGGAPTILLDAMAAGLPIISTRHCDIPFVVGEGAWSWLAEEGDIKGLTDGILYMVENRLNNPMPMLNRLNKNHDIKQVGKNALALYESIC